MYTILEFSNNREKNISLSEVVGLPFSELTLVPRLVKGRSFLDW